MLVAPVDNGIRGYRISMMREYYGLPFMPQTDGGVDTAPL